MAFSVMVIDPFPTAFLPPFSLRRRIIGCVCASLAGSSRSVPFGTPFPLASWQSPHPIYPCRKVLFNCQRTGGKRSPHFYSRKKRHFRKKVMKFFYLFLFCPSLPLAKLLPFVTKPSYEFPCPSFFAPSITLNKSLLTVINLP